MSDTHGKLVPIRPDVDINELRGEIQSLRRKVRRQEADAAREAEQGRVVRELRARVRLLASVSGLVHKPGDIEETILGVVSRIHSSFPELAAHYAIVDEAGQMQILALASPHRVLGIGPTTMVPEASGWIDALRSGEVIVADDVALDGRMFALGPVCDSLGVRSMVSVPLWHSERYLGVLCLGSAETRTWRTHEVESLSEVAALLSGAIHEASLRRQRERAEQALQQSEERYRRLVEMSPFAIWVVEDSRILYANAAGHSLIGASVDVKGCNVLSFFGPDEKQAVLKLLRDSDGDGTGSPETGAPAREMILRRMDGSTVAIDVTAAPIFYEGRPAYQLMMRDITERRRLEERVRQTHKMEAVGQLTAGIAHNFNNVLMGILPVLEEVVDLVDDAEVVHRLSEVQLAAIRAADLVQQMGLFTEQERPTAGGVSPREWLTSAVDMCRATFPRHIEIHLDCPQDLPALAGDRRELDQSLMNVLLNARDAVENVRGRRPVIRAWARQDPSPPRGVASPDRTYLRLDIIDNGVGMAEPVRKRVFEPFFTTKAPGEGTGLGLAALYAVVERVGGVVACQSEVGEGTTIRLWLPFADGQGTTFPDPVSERYRSASSGAFASEDQDRHVLVVDDEDLVRAVVSRTLVQAGYKVEEACDGNEGLAKYMAGSGRFDLVMLDLSMPGIPGDEVLRRIKQSHPEQKVMVLTGFQTSPDVERLADRVVEKPVSRIELVGHVQDTLGQGEGAQSKPT